MKKRINYYVAALVDYAISVNLAKKEDRTYFINGILDIFDIHEFTDTDMSNDASTLEEILGELLNIAIEKGIISDSIVEKDLFDTKIMGVVTPRPSEVISKFFELYKESPEKATDYFYRLCTDSDYIRAYRIKNDVKWTVPSAYGEIEITINLSKPEKDPKSIAALKNAKQSGYPLCNLCPENVGYSGSLTQPARQTLRQIPLTLAGADWRFQYSPYSYYNEHCIVLSATHTPMKINRAIFEKALDFVSQFPHYFLGSNADLPIVGGSILTHDHMQGGHHTFAMANAPVEIKLDFEGYKDIYAGIVKWPMSVIRLSGENKERLSELGEKILDAWRGYSDHDAFVFAETDGEPHNTITPIARFRDGRFELDLVLRNNITTEEHPLGVYHPHAEHHNIKKENIGLIEVMGLAVLPSRLKKEMAILADIVVNGEEITEDSPVIAHKAWFEKFKNNYKFTAENVDDILKEEIGKTFVRVLEDAGVYKCTSEGRAAFLRFVNSIS